MPAKADKMRNDLLERSGKLCGSMFPSRHADGHLMLDASFLIADMQREISRLRARIEGAKELLDNT